jgi:hypothetical protein
VCGYWSTKQILAHLASFEQMLLELLGQVTGEGAPTPTLDEYRARKGDEFNARQVKQRDHSTPKEVLEEYKKAQAQVMARIGQIPEGKLRQAGIIPWYGMEYDLEDFVVYTFYGHKREHMAQVAVYRDRLGK